MTTHADMEIDNNNTPTQAADKFCRLAWIAGALDAARRHHAGKSQDELTAFGLVSPVPVLHAMES
jgi:hypothetical protein